MSDTKIRCDRCGTWNPATSIHCTKCRAGLSPHLGSGKSIQSRSSRPKPRGSTLDPTKKTGETKTCKKCGHVLPATTSACSECGAVQWSNFTGVAGGGVVVLLCGVALIYGSGLFSEGSWLCIAPGALLALLSGAVILHSVIEIILGFRRQGRVTKRNVVGTVLILAVVVGLTTGIIIRARPSRRVLAIQEALAGVCQGEGVQTAAGLTPGHKPHPTVLLDASGSRHKWSNSLPRSWYPRDVGSAELVACIRDSSAELQVCRYLGGPPVTRYRRITVVELRDARTAELIDKVELKGDIPPPCKQKEAKYNTVLSGSSVKLGSVQDWLEHVVNARGSEERAQQAPVKADSHVISVAPCNAAEQEGTLQDKNYYLCMTSGLGDPVGQLGTWIATKRVSVWPSKPGELQLTWDSSSGDQWETKFATAAGKPWKADLYNDAVALPISTTSEYPGLSVRRVDADSGCNHLQGRFEILELAYNDLGQLEHLSINFEQYCTPKAQPLVGYLRYDSTYAGSRATPVPLQAATSETAAPGPSSADLTTKLPAEATGFFLVAGGDIIQLEEQNFDGSRTTNLEAFPQVHSYYPIVLYRDKAVRGDLLALLVPASGLGFAFERSEQGIIEQGVTVREVLSGFGAARSGLQKGDVVIAIDGQSLDGVTDDDFVLMAMGRTGSQAILTVLRGQETLELSVTRDSGITGAGLPYRHEELAGGYARLIPERPLGDGLHCYLDYGQSPKAGYCFRVDQ